MNTALRENGIVTVHDQVVSLVAQRWAKSFHCKVTIHTGLEQDPWAGPQQLCDIVGGQVGSSGNTIEWMAEVETDDSIKDVATVSKWREAVVRGIPFYLLVPRGLARLPEVRDAVMADLGELGIGGRRLSIVPNCLWAGERVGGFPRLRNCSAWRRILPRSICGHTESVGDVLVSFSFDASR